MKLTIESLDHQGRGISHLDGKVVFIENSLKEEEVDVDVINETTKYKEAVVKEYINISPKRVKSKCPFYDECGGCHLRHMSYEDTLTFKKEKVEDIIEKFAGIKVEANLIKNKNRDFYRNKIEVQVKNGICGFFKKKSHDVIEIDRCLNATEPINKMLLCMHLLHIENGKVTIRSNYNGEIILNIETLDEPDIEIEKIREKIKLVGIILNDKLIFGADHYIEIIDNILFKMTYNSFFQVNKFINEELFKIVKNNVDSDNVVLDMCCGVGTLSLVAATKAKKVYGIEIVENSIKDAIINSRMNKIENVNFMLGDAYKLLSKINDKIDTVIIDPPRSGLNALARETLLNMEPSKIIYISCDPITLGRDLNEFKTKYDVLKFYCLDMFSYTYHVECIALLSLKSVDK